MHASPAGDTGRVTTAVATTRRAGQGRLAGVDAARSAAVLGMIAVHVLPLTATDGGRSTADLVASGRSAATFAVLAGVGVALAARGKDLPRFAATLAVRAVLITLLGLALGALDSGVLVILAFYGVLFVLLLPFLAAGVRTLLISATVVALAGPVLSQQVRPGLDGLRGNPVLGDLREPGRLAADLLLTGTYPAIPWLAYLLLGLGVGRLALRRTRTAAGLLVAGLALAAAATALSRLLLGPLGGYAALAPLVENPVAVRTIVDASRLGTVPTDSLWWLATDGRHTSTPLDLASTAGIALALLAAALLLAGVARPVLAPLAALGGMPLSAYTLHLLVLSAVTAEERLAFYLAQVIALLVAAVLWRRYVGRGPLEAVLAAVSRLLARGLRARS